MRTHIECLESRQLLSTNPLLPHLDAQVYTTVPASGIGDVNPYGMAFAPNNFPTGGNVLPGDLLISNFNSATGGQGTGTTITRIKSNGVSTTFFRGTAPLGLDGGLAILSRGFVLVGNEPANSMGVPATTGSSILIIDKTGKLVGTLSGSQFLNGPWDFTAVEQNNGATVVLFVSNALSGTVTRMVLSVPTTGNHILVTSQTQIGSGYAHGANPGAFIIGPAGVAYDFANDTLYVNAEGNNAVYAIPSAMTTADHGKGTLIFSDNHQLHGPLGLILASNGNLILANADSVNASPQHPSELVEITTAGALVATKFIDPNDGGAFDIAESFTLGKHRFAYVDDNTNTVTVFTLPTTNAQPLLPQLNAQVYTTVASNGDVNPYGLAFVSNNIPAGGNLAAGDLLIGNFNDSGNAQGRGSTIARVKGDGVTTTFFKTSTPVGFDAGLAVLSRGFVLAGELPGTGGPNDVPASTGSQIAVINIFGKQVGTLSGPLFKGVWDFQCIDNGATAVLFVSNALTGVVSRITLSVPTNLNQSVQITSETQIGHGYTPFGANAAAFVVGPAGVAFDPLNGALYVSDEGGNAIFEIPDAMTTTDKGKGNLIFFDNHNLHGPLGLIFTNNDTLIIANSDGVNADPNHPSELVEITPTGTLLATKFIDPNDGGAFNIIESFTNGKHRFAYVDDNTATVTVFTL